MKKHFFLMATVFLLAACTASATVDNVAPMLTVGDGSTSSDYSAADLEAMEAAEATVQGTTYVGVSLATLLADAGVDVDSVSAVKVVAADGFSANFEPEMAARPDTLVAYARQGGALAEDELPFRMVLPAEGGKMNVRMVTEIEVIP